MGLCFRLNRLHFTGWETKPTQSSDLTDVAMNSALLQSATVLKNDLHKYLCNESNLKTIQNFSLTQPSKHFQCNRRAAQSNLSHIYKHNLDSDILLD